MQITRSFLTVLVCSAAFLMLPSGAIAASGAVPSSHKGYVYVRATTPPVKAYMWANATWYASTPPARARVWVEPYQGGWLWMYRGTKWYAVDHDDVTTTKPRTRRKKRAAPARRTSASALAINSPATDNYKASYNADPNTVERRTWLNWTGVRVGGRTYRAVAGQAQIGSRLKVRDSRGNNLILKLRSSSSNVEYLAFRFGPQPNLSGVFVQLRSRGALANGPLRIRMIVETPGGRRVATKALYYRYDRALATAPRGNIEHNGPGGRWYIGSRRTRTNVEIGRR